MRPQPLNADMRADKMGTGLGYLEENRHFLPLAASGMGLLR